MLLEFLQIFLLILKIALIFVCFFAFFILLILFSPDSLKAAIKWSPFEATPFKVIKKALKEANLKPGEVLVDLGCGTGKVLVVGAIYFGAKVIGYEYSFLLFLISKINLFYHGIRDGKVFHKDFFEADLSSTDVVFLFLTPRALKKIEKKLERELKSGARVIVFSSPIISWEPKKVIVPENNFQKPKIYIYIKN